VNEIQAEGGNNDRQQSPCSAKPRRGWIVGTSVSIPALWTTRTFGNRNTTHQLIVPSSEATAPSIVDDATILKPGDREIQVRRVVQPNEGEEHILTGNPGTRSFLFCDPNSLS